MNDMQKRFILFLGGCMVVRLLFTYAAYRVSVDNLRYLGYLALVPVIGWLWIMFVSPRDTGDEVFGEKIWWKSLRPIHMVLYLLFSILAISGNKNAWVVLLVDTLFGLGAFLRHHYIEGNFSKL